MPDNQLKEGFALAPSTWQPLPGKDLVAELLALAKKELSEAILLGTADDGVLWGRLQQGRLRLAKEVLGVGGSLCPVRLQSLRLFSREGELRLRRSAGALSWAFVAEDSQVPALYQDVRHPLLGKAKEEPPKEDFTLLHGSEGERHAPPLLLTPKDRGYLALRRYYQQDEAGLYRLTECRYLALTKEEESHE